MSNIENALHAVRKNGKWYVSGGGGANIITANSKAELPDPSTVPEGTIALVPSAGGDVSVVEEGNTLTVTLTRDGKVVSTAVATYDEEGNLLTVVEDGVTYNFAGGA